MASKNLGAVIQRAISDGAFRRQLQSDPAAALRGFNLSPDEIAAIRSGDSSKLMSLGVDQRMSKAFTVGGGLLGATRSASSDMSSGATANALDGDQTAGTREGIVGDPTTGSRDAVSTGDTSGVRAINDVAPADGTVNAASDPTQAGVRAVHDTEPTDLRAAATAGDASGTRAVHDSEPADLRSAATAGDASGVRAVHDVPPFEGNVNATADASTGPGDNMIAADDSYSVASRMADTGTDSARAIHDIAPFDSGIANAAAPGSEFIGGDIQHDPGMDATHNFVPSDSADVQREMLDGIHGGDALGNAGGGGNTSS